MKLITTKGRRDIMRHTYVNPTPDMDAMDELFPSLFDKQQEKANEGRSEER